MNVYEKPEVELIVLVAEEIAAELGDTSNPFD